MATLTLEQFGQKIKAKYPQYGDMSDADLGQKMLAKYPEYNDMVTSVTPQKKGFIEKAGDFLGVSNIGKSIAQFIFNQTPTGKDLANKIQSGTANEYEKQAYDEIKKDNPTLKQIIGDVIQVGATVGTAGIGGTAAKGALGAAKTIGAVSAAGATAGLGAGLSADKSIKDSLIQAFSSGVASAATAGTLTAIGKLGSAALKKLPVRLNQSIAKLDKESAQAMLDNKWWGTAGRIKAVADDTMETSFKRITEKISQQNGTITSNDYLSKVVSEVKNKWQGASYQEIYDAIRKFKVDPFLNDKKVDFLTAANISSTLGKELKTAWKMEGNYDFNKTVGFSLWQNIVNTIRPVTNTTDDFKLFKNALDTSYKLKKLIDKNEKNLGFKVSDLLFGGVTGALGGGVAGGAAIAAKKVGETAIAKSGTAIALNELNKVIEKIPQKYFDAQGRITRTALVKALSESTTGE